MTSNFSGFFGFFNIFVILLLVIGFYCLIVTKNLVRVLIGLEILIKAVTLLIILAGYITGKMATAQTLVITLIVVEVVVMAVGAGIVISVFNKNNSLDVRNLRNLKG